MKKHKLIGTCETCRFSRSMQPGEAPDELIEHFPLACEGLPPAWQVIPRQSKLALARDGVQEVQVIRPPSIKRREDGCVFWTPEGPVAVE